MNKYTVGEFIYKKRKEKGLTQSQLGEMLGVSNKAVSKWENGESFPEFSAIQPLCDILGVTADELVNGREKNTQQPPVEEVPFFEAPDKNQLQKSKVQMSASGKKFEKKFYIAIAVGVFLCVLSVAALFFSQLLGASVGLSVSTLLLCVAIGVFLFISFGIKHEHYQKGYDQAFIDKCQKYAYVLAFGIVMAILSPCIFLMLNQKNNGHHGELLTLTLFFVWIAIAVLLIVFAGLGIGKTKKQWNIEDDTENETLQDKLCSIVMLGATAIFLLCGFVWGSWHPMWVVFPVGGIICGIIDMTKKGE